jgi:hypothetical protein
LLAPKLIRKGEKKWGAGTGRQIKREIYMRDTAVSEQPLQILVSQDHEIAVDFCD